MDDIFHERVDGLWPSDFERMLLAAAWKDAVTAYEVYVENSLHEVLQFQRLKYEGKDPDRGPSCGR
jgi:hypothetical protein